MSSRFSCLTPPLLAASLLLSIMAAHGAEAHTIWPGTNAPQRLHGDNSFKLETQGQVLNLSFKDQTNSDDYTHLDLGVLPLAEYVNGGYVEVEAELDNPILRLGLDCTEPGNFWGVKQTVEGEALLQTGLHTYRFYLDSIAAPRAAANKDHLYLIVHDLGHQSRGEARLQIRKITLRPPVPNWEDEKRTVYAKQYQWPKAENIEPLYYEHYENTVDWKQVSQSPFLTRKSLNGSWRKQFFGERTWNYTFLADQSYAQPAFKDAGWKLATIPEPPTEEQAGGYFWYRREVELAPVQAQGKMYLRFEDLSEDARIYVNGQLVGTQSSVAKQLNWVVENGSRNLLGTPVKKGITWQQFDRTGIPSPFDAQTVPEDKKRLILPLYYGEFSWPYAYEVSRFLRPGKNTIAVRIYGNPMKGWWIHRHRSDRAARNVFGILGDVFLVSQKSPAIDRFTRLPAKTVDADGTALQRFQCSLAAPARSKVKLARFRCNDQEQTVAVQDKTLLETAFHLPAAFTQYRAVVDLLDGQGAVVDHQEIDFHGVVVETKERRIWVNGEPYLVRGINAYGGVEWNNDRRVTREEFVRTLRQFQQLGINTIRLGVSSTWEVQEALRYGIMVMPLSPAASTDWSIGAFGQLTNPDYRLAADRQRNMVMLLQQEPGVLLWNDGNEIHHTPGYVDRPVLLKYLAEMQRAIKECDPYQRPVTFANLDHWRQNWMFLGSQDVIGWNLYQEPPPAAEDAREISAATGDKPLLITEWGTLKGKPDREGKVDAWESEMRKKWAIISGPDFAGQFLFAWHGELEDERGRNFLRSLYLPYQLNVQGDTAVFMNRSEAVMRNLSLQVLQGQAVFGTKLVSALAPGASCEIKIPTSPGGMVEIGYESHGGLQHHHLQNLVPQT